ncbi:MAG: hypothetical protein LBU28_01760 [Spirochaetaceae bacterium]|jgi:hypothetical protein|nr:hypothetical protein [Spirochaetaceae bacterium]
MGQYGMMAKRMPSIIEWFNPLPVPRSPFVLYPPIQNEVFSNQNDMPALNAGSVPDTYIIKSIFLKENEKEKEEKALFKKTFLLYIKESVYEYGFSSEAEDYLNSRLKNDGAYYREWINELFLNHIDNEAVVIGLLRIISHIAYDDIFPVGMTIAAASLSHKSNLVKENAIRAFENWEEPRNITLLESIECTDPLLNNYISQVIQDLKEKLECPC